MEKITKEELTAKLDLKDSPDNDLAKIVAGDESDASIKKCIEECMRIFDNYDRCRLSCTYGG